MRRTRGGYPVSTGDLIANEHLDVLEIGDRYLEPGHRLDGDTPHPGDAAGEGDTAGYRSPHRVADIGCEVHAPMTGVLADGEERGDHRAGDRRTQAHRGDGKDSEHLNLPLRT